MHCSTDYDFFLWPKWWFLLILIKHSHVSRLPQVDYINYHFWWYSCYSYKFCVWNYKNKPKRQSTEGYNIIIINPSIVSDSLFTKNGFPPFTLDCNFRSIHWLLMIISNNIFWIGNICQARYTKNVKKFLTDKVIVTMFLSHSLSLETYLYFCFWW